MMRTLIRKTVPIALLLLGVDLWMTVVHAETGRPHVLRGLGIIVVLCAIWPLCAWLLKTSDRVDGYVKRYRAIAAAAVAVIVASHLLLEARRFWGELHLKYHDEHAYLIQAHMLAIGRLWMPAYPAGLRGFFDSFYLIVDRVYAGMYPPGTAMMLVPGIWLGMAFWIMPLLTCAAGAAFFYLVLQEMFGAVRATVGVFLLASLTEFMSTSFMALSEAPFFLAQMMALWAWMRWRSSRKFGWLLFLGAASGYGAITRPADMFCVASAIGLAIVYELRREPKVLARSVALIAVAAAPFLAVLIVQNIGVTGRWDQTAVRYYTDQNYPSPILSFRHVDAHDVPPTQCLPKRAAMKQWILPLVENHWHESLAQIWYPERANDAMEITLPNPLLVILLPLAVLSLVEIRRGVIVGSMLLFVLVYTFDAVFLKHYLMAIAPGMVCLVLMGWESLEREFPRIRAGIFVFMLFGLGVTGINALPEFNPWARPQATGTGEEIGIGRVMATLPPRPALVMFRYDPKVDSFHIEPVYNEVAWPDDARIVRARDLGENENVKLYRYYAERGQNRDVYLYDRGVAPSSALKFLGTAGDLCKSR